MLSKKKHLSKTLDVPETITTNFSVPKKAKILLKITKNNKKLELARWTDEIDVQYDQLEKNHIGSFFHIVAAMFEKTHVGHIQQSNPDWEPIIMFFQLKFEP